MPEFLPMSIRRILLVAERERERLNTGIEEPDLELTIGDRSRLSNQLIQADRVVVARTYVSAFA